MHRNISFHFKDIAGVAGLTTRARVMLDPLYRLNTRIVSGQLSVQAERDMPGRRPSYLIKLGLTVPGAAIHADNRHVPATARRNLLSALRAVTASAKHQLIELRDRRAAMHARSESH